MGKVVDTRNYSLTHQVISNVTYDYIDFLAGMTPPLDVEKHRADLITFLNAFETLRHNCITDYAPEYAPFLKQYGYDK